MARKGDKSATARVAAFTSGLQSLGIDGRLNDLDDPNFARLSQTLKALRNVSPLAKPRIIKACASTVLADEHVTVSEGAWLQGIAATLDCPLPPAIYDHLRERGNIDALG